MEVPGEVRGLDVGQPDELTWTDLGHATLQSVEIPGKNPPGLPLESIDPEAFERLVAEIVTERDNVSVHFYGRRGQRQYGLDIVEELRDGTRVLYQVRRYATVSPRQIREAVRDYAGAPRSRGGVFAEPRPFDPKRFVLVTAAEIDHDVAKVDAVSGLQSEYRGDLQVDVWSREVVSRRLRSMPYTVAAVFGDAWVREYCGADALRKAKRQAAAREAAEAALVAAVASQYQHDDPVQFRQVDLVGISVDSLFVDVPVSTFANSPAAALLEELTAGATPDSEDSEPEPYDLVGHAGAAQVLLHPKWVGSAVIVGGPGQGKTTLLQFLCQFHRARILGYENAYSPVAAGLAPVSDVVRTPLKVELSKYAQWRRELLAVDGNSSPGRSRTAPATVESYLLDLVAERSGMQFNREAMTKVLASRPLLLALDGLDEIANLGEREEVADEIRDTRIRLEALGRDVIVLVATRPGHVGRPIWREQGFSPLFLGSLTPPLRMAYLQRWARSTKLLPAQVDDLKNTFVAGMSLGHVAELAGNPMQLAILLHLMQRRAVLPEKRTDLYARYIDVFWDRESEHSLVAAKKELVLPFHKLLAWHIQTKIELKESDGTISRSDLKDLLTGYLQPRSQSPEVIDEIFASVTGRVLCLVALDQDSAEFQFEVQPLREYFAAEHIYDMSPNDKPQNNRHATLGVLARRPYWSNVMRFFAGKFSPGETPSIIYMLRTLLRDPKIGEHPIVRITAKLLLDDSVFAGQLSLVLEDALGIVIEEPGPTLAADGLLQGDTSSSLLTERGGAEQAAGILSRRLADPRHLDDPASTVRLIKELGGTEEARRLLWQAHGDLAPERWLVSLADLCRLQPVGKDGVGLLEDAAKKVPGAFPLLGTLIEARARPIVDALIEHSLGEISEGRFDPPPSLDPHFEYARIARSCTALPFYEHLNPSTQTWTASIAVPGLPRPRTQASPSTPSQTKVRSIEAIHAASVDWAGAETWSRSLDDIAGIWGGDSWPIREALTLAPLSELHTRQMPASITTGARWQEVLSWRLEARQQANSADWWKKQADLESSDQIAAMTYLLSALQIASTRTIEAICQQLGQLAGMLDRRQLSTVVGGLARYRSSVPTARTLVLDDSLRLKKIAPSVSLSVLLWQLANEAAKPYLATAIADGMQDLWSAGPSVGQTIRNALTFARNRIDPLKLQGGRLDLPAGTLASAQLRRLSFEQAQSILRAPHLWPSDLVRHAAERLDARLAGQTPVAMEAEARRWGI